MGRELKRVPLDFEWPLSMVWKGYVNPYSGRKCAACDGSGSDPAMKELSDSWYGLNDPSKRWSDKLTQDEVDALVASNRLMSFTHTWEGEKGWQPRKDGYRPTADEVNTWSRRGFGHDALNMWICVRTRAERLGIIKNCDDGKCRWCDGDGVIWPEEKYQKLCEEWQRIEPPEGDGYQVWETVSEGAPISPVFAMPEDLARWMEDHPWGAVNANYDQWMKFILGPGWAPTGISQGGIYRSGVEAI